MRDYILINDCLYLKETTKAFLMSIAGTDYWVPKSQIKPGCDVVRMGRGPIEVAKWWYDTNFLSSGNKSSGGRSSASSGGGSLADPAQLEVASKVYRRLVAKYHPDTNSDSQEIMTDINELWQAVKKALK